MNRKAQPNLLRRINERAVFELVRRHGSTSRADLKRYMGISAPTVSKAVARLLTTGFLEEVGIAPPTGVGRPVMVYQLARGNVQVLGATISIRQTSVSAAGLDGRIDPDSTIEFDTPNNYPELITQIALAAKRLIRRNRSITTLGLGVSAPGEIDTTQQRVLFSPNLHLLNNTSPSVDLQKRLKIDTFLFHDTIAAALAEQQYGQAKDLTDFVRIGVWEGFGAAVVSNGRILNGRHGLAGELGHVTVEPNGKLCGCGNHGCLETVATDTAFARLLSKRLPKPLTIESILSQCAAGTLNVQPELDQTLSYLAIGIAAAINLFNPQAILLSCRMLDCDPASFDRLKQMVATRALPPLLQHCQILRVGPQAQQGSIAGIIQHLTDTLGPLIA